MAESTDTAVREAREQIRQLNELIKTNHERRHGHLAEASAREDDISLLTARRDSWEQLLKDAESGSDKPTPKDEKPTSKKAAAKKTADK